MLAAPVARAANCDVLRMLIIITINYKRTYKTDRAS